MLKDRGFDPSHILLPTAGDPDSVLGAEVVRPLRSEFDSRVTLLYALSEGESYEDGELFLTEWAAETGLDDAETIVDDRDVECSVLLAETARERTLRERLLGITDKF